MKHLQTKHPLLFFGKGKDMAKESEAVAKDFVIFPGHCDAEN